jgi:threonine aldolase
MVDRLAEDHARAYRLAEGLAAIEGVSVDLDTVQTNIVIFQTTPSIEQAEFVAQMKERGVLVSNYGTRGVRMVTHYEIDDAAIDTALSAAADVMSRNLVAA